MLKKEINKATDFSSISPSKTLTEGNSIDEENNSSKNLNNPISVHTFVNNKLILYEIKSLQISTIECPPINDFPNDCFPSIIIKDGVFVTGGFKDENALKSCFMFDIGKSQMLRPSDMFQKRYSHSLLMTNNQFVFALAGHDNVKPLRQCEKYDLVSDKWQLIPNLNDDRSCLTGFSFENKFLYVFGGWSESIKSYLSDIEKIDIIVEKEGWKKIQISNTSWISKCGSNVCQVSDHTFLIFGGANSEKDLDDSFIFDTRSNSVQLKTKMKKASHFFNQCSQTALYNNTVFSIDNDKSMQYYDIKSNQWFIYSYQEWNSDQDS